MTTTVGQAAVEPPVRVPPCQPSNDALKSDVPDPTPDLLNRLDNWKHSVGLLEDYVQGLIALQKNTTSGYEKVRKTINDAPRFDYAEGSRLASAGADTGIGVPGSATAAGAGAPVSAVGSGTGAGSQTTPQGPVGIAEAFAALRTRTEFLLNKSGNTEQQLRSAIIPQLDTLRGDIDKHYKGLKGPGLKGMKEVDRAKERTQKFIEALAQGAASYGGAGGGTKSDARGDPYLKHRLVLNSVDDQVNKENTQSDAVASMQNNFRTLETHIVQVLQQSVSVLEQIMRGWGDSQSEAFVTVSNYFNHIAKDHEWNQYVRTHAEILVPEGMPKRQARQITFANMDHDSVIPVMEGTLQRKGTVMKQYHTGYYVLTKSGYLHEFKSKDFVQDPEPERSLHIPGCVVGPASPRESGKFKFSVQGKDLSKSLSTKHTFMFRTNTYDEMIAWHDALSKVAGSSGAPAAVAGGASTSPTPAAPAAVNTNADINTGYAAGAIGTAGAAGAGEQEVFQSHAAAAAVHATQNPPDYASRPSA